MEIIIAGGGKIGEVCLKALQQRFSKLYILGDQLEEYKRESDVIIRDFFESPAKYVLLAGWDKIIYKEFLKEKKFINIHGSILPKYRGLHSLFWMIMNDEKYLGFTIHEVNEYIDDGDILYQFSFEYQGEEISQIHNHFYLDLEKNLANIIVSYMNEEIKLLKQNKDEATWVPRRNLNDCLVDYNMSVEMMERFFKALTAPYPLPRVQLNGDIYEILEGKLIKKEYYCETGRVVNIDDEGVWITVKNGLLVINTLNALDKESLIQAKDIFKMGQRLKN